jgi:hypothetical protein
MHLVTNSIEEISLHPHYQFKRSGIEHSKEIWKGALDAVRDGVREGVLAGVRDELLKGTMGVFDGALDGIHHRVRDNTIKSVDHGFPLMIVYETEAVAMTALLVLKTVTFKV